MSTKKKKAFPKQQQAKQPGSQHEMTPQPETAPRYPGNGRLRGQIAVITGGDSGIGRSVAEHFANEGCSVAIVYKDEDLDAEQAKEAVEAHGVQCLNLRGDLGELDFCTAVIERVRKELGEIDILVNNAAEQHIVEDVAEHDDAMMLRTFQTNIFGSMRLSYAALATMRPGSRIINTVSVVAYDGHPQLMDYAATKGAQVAFTRSLAQRLASKPIRVNAVAPGPIWTPLIPASFPPEKVESFGSNTPLGRAGQPNEVAPAYVYLASDDSSYVTGQVIHINGGRPVSG